MLSRGTTGRRGVLLALALLAVAVMAVWWERRNRLPSTRSGAEDGEPTPASISRSAPAPVGQTGSLSGAAQRLRFAADAQAARRVFTELRDELRKLDKAAAQRAILAALDSGADAPSGLGFVVGPGGSLKEAPSLRVFLLDHVAEEDPAAAAAYAEKVLAGFTTPDEWAVSLRNYARGRSGPEARAFLQRKWREMVRHEPWLKNPSTGFLEAFDVAVHAGGTELLPDLAALLRQTDHPAVAHAAYLALDRLVIQDAASVLGALQRQPDLLVGREQTRANYFARANVADAAQRGLIEAYLLSPQVTPAELTTFAGVFPNANFMVSPNLLTRVATPAGADLARQDREALRVVEAWLADPRFRERRLELERIRARLETFVGAAPVTR
jgi:hypothetical protein